MKSLIFTLLIFLLLASPLIAQGFDIQAFSDSTKYGWNNYQDREAYRKELSSRQRLLQIYELEAQPMNANIVKSAIIPGWGQFSAKSPTKATIILGSELVLVGSALYFLDRSLSNYRMYETATQVEDIENFYKDAQVPYQYSFILLGFAGIVWVYNIFDVIQSTQSYNAKVWQNVVERSKTNQIQISPNGVEVRF